MQPVSSRFRSDGLQAATYIGFPILAGVSVWSTLRAGLRSPLAWAPVAAFAIAGAIMVGQVRILIYVTWFGLPFVAAAAQRLAEHTRSPALAQALAAVLASPPIVTLGIAALAHGVAQAHDRTPNSRDHLSCFVPASFGALAALPRRVTGPSGNTAARSPRPLIVPMAAD